MKLAKPFFCLVALFLSLILFSQNDRDDPQNHRELQSGGGLLGLLIVLATVFTRIGRRRFLSCQLGINVCICSSEDLTSAIENEKDSNICWSTGILIETELDITSKSFSIGCDEEICNLIGSNSRFASGSPTKAQFDSISFSDFSGDMGGAMMLTGGSTTCTNCQFFDNTASGSGGSLHVSNGAQVVLNSPIISSGTAGASGGGIYVTGDSTTVTLTGREGSISFADDFFNFNVAENGGAIAVDGGGSLTMKDVTFLCRNSATFGDNIFIGEDGTVECDMVEFEGRLGINGTSATCEASVVLTEETTCP